MLGACGIAQPGRLQRRDSGTGAPSPDTSAASSSNTGGTDGGWAGWMRGDDVGLPTGFSRGESSRRFSLIVSTDDVWLRLKLCGSDWATAAGASCLLGIE